MPCQASLESVCHSIPAGHYPEYFILVAGRWGVEVGLYPHSLIVSSWKRGGGGGGGAHLPIYLKFVGAPRPRLLNPESAT